MPGKCPGSCIGLVFVLMWLTAYLATVSVQSTEISVWWLFDWIDIVFRLRVPGSLHCWEGIWRQGWGWAGKVTETWFFFTDCLSHVLLSGHSDTFSKYNKKLFFIKAPYCSFAGSREDSWLQSEKDDTQWTGWELLPLSESPVKVVDCQAQLSLNWHTSSSNLQWNIL